MPPLLLKTDFLEEFLLAIEENNIIKNKSKIVKILKKNVIENK